MHNLASGPGVSICDVCVRLCVDITAAGHDDEHLLDAPARVEWGRITDAPRP